ncbi:MAG: type II secretion system inner membrane protein GspF [Gammaproteobacteria bacterium]|nr:type II secretion system inner membrane protein GspF [Gammaproteobacteria bacterium]
MAAFEYVALDAKGREQKGVTEGETPRHVRQLLRNQGLMPVSITEAAVKDKKQTEEKPSAFSFQRGISATDLALFTRQLATLLSASLPLEESLAAVGQQTETPRIKSMIFAIRAKVLEGHTLANGLAEFPRAFPELYIATVAAGEETGYLEDILERLADYTENRQLMRQKVSMAMLYPIILTIMAVIVVLGLMTYVVPQVVSVFDNINQELPALTVGMMATSDFLISYGIFLLLGLAGAVATFKTWLKNENNRFRYHQFILTLPLVGKLSRSMNTARFARTLSILSLSGVPILEALRIAGQVVSNLPMRQAVLTAADKVREGSNVSTSLEQSGLFPPMTIRLISSGESSGKMEEMLERSAVQQERELESMISLILGIFEPVLILAMGVVVLIIVLAILLPIFELNQLVA